MKQITILLFIAMALVACNNTQQQQQALQIASLQRQQDSLKAALQHQQDSLKKASEAEQLQRKKDAEGKFTEAHRSEFLGLTYNQVRQKLLLKISLFDLDEGVFDDSHEKWIETGNETSYEKWYNFNKSGLCKQVVFKVPTGEASKYIAQFNDKGFVRDDKKNCWRDTIGKCKWTIENMYGERVQVTGKLE